MIGFTQIAGFIGEEKDRLSMTFGGEPRRLSIVGGLEGDGSLPAPDADISVAIRKGTSRDDAIALLSYAIAEVHGLPQSSTEGLDLVYTVTASLTAALSHMQERKNPARDDNVVLLHPHA